MRKAIEEAEKNGVILTEAEFLDQKKKEEKPGKYEYFKPKDECYELENRFKFCTKDGFIKEVIREPEEDLVYNKDFFFLKKSYDCKLYAYNFMYNFFYKKRLIRFHEYQLAMPLNLYPNLIRVVIVAKDDILDPEELDELEAKKSPLAKYGEKHSFDGDLLVFYVSEKRGVGCMPIKQIKLYKPSEESLYPLFVSKFKLVGPWIDGIDFEDRIFIELDGPYLKKYGINELADDDIKLIEVN